MKKTVVWIIVVVAVLGIAGLVAWHYWHVETINLEEYTPSEEFEPAWDAMEATAPEYDIEETVRAMNALEVAQCQSEDFMSYLEYVAKQDFSRVAPEVLEQKKKLFPILQRLYELQKEHEELDDVWMLMRSATSGAGAFVSEVNPVGVIGSMLTGDATLSTVSVGSGMEKVSLAGKEGRNLQDICHLGHRLGLVLLMDIRHHGQLEFLGDALQYLQGFLVANACERVQPGAVGLAV